jgi:hypothetical protein
MKSKKPPPTTKTAQELDEEYLQSKAFAAMIEEKNDRINHRIRRSRKLTNNTSAVKVSFIVIVSACLVFLVLKFSGVIDSHLGNSTSSRFIVGNEAAREAARVSASIDANVLIAALCDDGKSNNSSNSIGGGEHDYADLLSSFATSFAACPSCSLRLYCPYTTGTATTLLQAAMNIDNINNQSPPFALAFIKYVARVPPPEDSASYTHHPLYLATRDFDYHLFTEIMNRITPSAAAAGTGTADNDKSFSLFRYDASYAGTPQFGTSLLHRAVVMPPDRATIAKKLLEVRRVQQQQASSSSSSSELEALICEKGKGNEPLCRLYSNEQTFVTLVQQYATNATYSAREVYASEILLCISNLQAKFVTAFLNARINPKDFTLRMVKNAWTPMHVAATSGNTLALDAISSWLNAQQQKLFSSSSIAAADDLDLRQYIQQVKLQITTTFKMKDYDGRTPAHLARRLWGNTTSVPIIESMERLAGIASDTEERDGIFWNLVETTVVDSFGEKSIDVDLYEHSARQTTAISSSAAATTSISEDDGGWGDMSQAQASKWETKRCDGVQVMSLSGLTSLNESGSSSSELAAIVSSVILKGTPVLFRGVLLEDVHDIKQWNNMYREAWRKDNFRKEFGHYEVPVADIPYAAGFGEKEEIITIGRYIDDFMEEEGKAAAKGSTSSSYIFSTALRNLVDIPPPQFILDGFTKLGDADDAADDKDSTTVTINSNGEQVEETKKQSHISSIAPQFYVGGEGSGAPVHYHNEAFNALAWGRKKWALYPPAQAFYSTTPARETWEDEDKEKEKEEEKETSENAALYCFQEAGDILFVPNSWGHGTYNAQSSIGIAWEIQHDLR